MDSESGMFDDNNKGYYLTNKEKIMKQVSSLIKTTEKLMRPNYSESDIHHIEEKTRIELENLLSRLPYVGGDKGPYTALMLQSAQTIAFYKACTSLNLPEREIGKLVYEIGENLAQSMSSVTKWFYRKSMFSKKMKNYWREWLNESLKHQYPENWVGEFIEGDKKNFDYGINFIECGCLKLMQNEGAEKIAPYTCLCDYARMQMLGIGFKRTQTLATGADFCDFRFIKNYHTQRGWPPENLEENQTSQALEIFGKK